MRWDKFTVMSQEAIQAAQTKAEELGHQEVRPEHLLWSFLTQEENIVLAVLAKIGANRAKIQADAETAIRRIPQVQGGEVYLSSAVRQVMNSAQKEADALKDEYISTEHLFLAMIKDRGSEAARILRDNGVTEEAVLQALMAIRGNAADNRPSARRQVPGAPKIHARFHRARPPGQARPGHRAGRRDPAGHPGPVPTDEKQSRPHRGSRRGEDGDRRRPRPAHRQRRRSPALEEQAAPRPGYRRPHRRDEVPGRIRGPAESHPQGDQGIRGRGHPVHRRAPYDHRRRRGGRGDGRFEYAQAGAGPGRVALRGGDDPQRISKAHREGRRARTAFPAGLCRRAFGRGHDLDPPRPEGEVRDPPWRQDQGCGSRRRRDALQPVYLRPLSPGQGHRPDRRGGLAHPDRDRQPARGDRRARAADPPDRDRAPGPQKGEGPRLQGPA